MGSHRNCSCLPGCPWFVDSEPSEKNITGPIYPIAPVPAGPETGEISRAKQLGPVRMTPPMKLPGLPEVNRDRTFGGKNQPGQPRTYVIR